MPFGTQGHWISPFFPAEDVPEDLKGFGRSLARATSDPLSLEKGAPVVALHRVGEGKVLSQTSFLIGIPLA